MRGGGGGRVRARGGGRQWREAGGAMRSSVWVFCGALVALAAARTDHDFEFDEAAVSTRPPRLLADTV